MPQVFWICRMSPLVNVWDSTASILRGFRSCGSSELPPKSLMGLGERGRETEAPAGIG